MRERERAQFYLPLLIYMVLTHNHIISSCLQQINWLQIVLTMELYKSKWNRIRGLLNPVYCYVSVFLHHHDVHDYTTAHYSYQYIAPLSTTVVSVPPPSPSFYPTTSVTTTTTPPFTITITTTLPTTTADTTMTITTFSPPPRLQTHDIHLK